MRYYAMVLAVFVFICMLSASCATNKDNPEPSGDIVTTATDPEETDPQETDPDTTQEPEPSQSEEDTEPASYNTKSNAGTATTRYLRERLPVSSESNVADLNNGGGAYIDDVKEKTEALKKYLNGIYGKKVLAGQQIRSKSMVENLVVYKETGKLPAILGMDLNGAEYDESNDWMIVQAIEWQRECNGIVSLMWHWAVPKDISGSISDRSYRPKNATYPDGTTFDLSKAFVPGTDENKLMLRCFDGIAGQLRRLEMAGVPVLFRPFHEASGGWFWWGAHGPALYKMLWNTLYERLTEYHGLTNLIWVWNGQSIAWMPNEKTFDIAGTDTYPKDNYQQSQAGLFGHMSSWTKKPLALSETGPVPSIDNMVKDKAMWLYWMTWCDEFTYTVKNGDFVPSDLTPAAVLKKNYLSDYVITLDELPQLGADTKRGKPAPVKYYDEEGVIEGQSPKWKNGQLKLEFEFATKLILKGAHSTIRQKDIYSAGGAVVWCGKDTATGARLDELSFTIDCPEAGTYTCDIYYSTDNFKGEKRDSWIVNGNAHQVVFPYPSNGVKKVTLTVTLNKGENIMEMGYGHGYVILDYLQLTKK